MMGGVDTSDVGDAIRSTVTYETPPVDEGDPWIPTDPTTATATVRGPDGTVTPYAEGDLEHPGPGLFAVVFTPTTPGVWVVRHVGVGAVAATVEKLYLVRPLAIEGVGLGFYGGNPDATERDRVRFAIGDTDNADLLLLDLEVDFLISSTANVTEAAIAAAHAVAARFSRLVDGSTGDISRSYSQRAAAYRTLAEQLRKADLETRASSTFDAHPLVAAGGIDRELDFAVGMMDRPGTVLGTRRPDPRADW